MRSCNRCLESKSPDQFSRLATGRDGLNPVCRSCRAELARIDRVERGAEIRQADRLRYEADPTAKKASFKKWSSANAELRRGRERARYLERREIVLAQKIEYRKGNKAKIYALNGNRRAALRQACPEWVPRNELAAIYAAALEMTERTGTPYHVDHEIPLSHPKVCGLHVPCNLTIITAADNLAKSNRWDENYPIPDPARIRSVVGASPL